MMIQLAFGYHTCSSQQQRCPNNRLLSITRAQVV